MIATEVRREAFEFDSFFVSSYAAIARVLIRVVKDPARAEELAVDVFCKLLRHPEVYEQEPLAWAYRTAVRAGLDELRRQSRRERFERLFGITSRVPTPEQLHSKAQLQSQVRAVLARLSARHAELLVLRSNDLSYEEVASSLNLNPASVGTLIRRAQDAFRKEYVKHYGKP